MLTAAIFDLNGIFITSEKLSERFERDYQIPSEEFWKVTSGIMDQVRKPNAPTAFSLFKPHFANWDVKLSEEKFWDYWFGGEKPSEQMVSLARELKDKGIKVFMLSNNFKERSEFYGHYPWMNEIVEKAYYSWQTGFVKPNPEAWENLLEENNLKAVECVYFDDREKNIKAAQSVGIDSHLFIDAQTTKQIIKQHV